MYRLAWKVHFSALKKATNKQNLNVSWQAHTYTALLCLLALLSPLPHLKWLLRAVPHTVLQWADERFPQCEAHGKPCVLRTVLKEGANNGRRFFACSRPTKKQCQYFQWADQYNTLIIRWSKAAISEWKPRGNQHTLGGGVSHEYFPSFT